MNGLFVLVMGNIGTGKSTFIDILKCRQNRIVIKADDFNDPDELTESIWQSLNKNFVVLHEGVFTQKNQRSDLIQYLKRMFPGVKIICFDFGPGDDDSLKLRAENSSEKHMMSGREYI